MSLIGTLEQYTLPSLLQRIEAHSKTGVFLVRQGPQWVELYIRSGQLLCIGPVRPNTTLGDRLLQDGVISSQVLREVLLAIGEASPSETRMALALMEMGHVSQDDLRAWAAQKAREVLQVVLVWSTGEIYFEEEVPPPAGRLLVALSLSSLLASLSAGPIRPVTTQMPAPAPNPIYGGATATNSTQGYLKAIPPMPAPAAPATPANPTTPPPAKSDVSRIPTLTGTSQFMMSNAELTASRPQPATETLAPLFDASQEISFASLSDEDDSSFGLLDSDADLNPAMTNAPMPPERVMSPVQPPRIDTSFMRPDMVLMPGDFASANGQNPRIQLTPDQWRVLTRVNGHTTLHAACQELSMLPALVCQVVGELVAMGLIQLALGSTPVKPPMSPMAQRPTTPGFASTTSQPWAPALPTSDVMPPQFSPDRPFETESQWGNGGNKANFVPGRGWVASPQPLQPLQPGGSLASTSSFAHVGNGR